MTTAKRKVRFSEMFSVFVCILFSLVTTPVAAVQYLEWHNGNDFSLPFMILGVLFPLMAFAHILKIRRR